MPILENIIQTESPPSAPIDITPPLLKVLSVSNGSNGAAGTAVGIRHFHALDPSRDDISTGKRQFMVTAFYPGKPDQNAPRARLIDILYPRTDAALQSLSRESGLDEAGKTSAFDHVKKMTLRAQRNLALESPEPRPVLIYYPGGLSHRLSNAAVCESLAARGFIVFALDAPRDAPIVVFPDGSMVTPPAPENENYIWPRVADVRFLLDQLEDLNRTAFAGHLDLGRIGMFGCSRGGYLSNICAVEDHRIKAAVNMDGFLWGLWTQQGTGLDRFPPGFPERARTLTTPILRLRGDQGGEEKARRGFEEESRDFGGDFISVAIHGFKHHDFGAVPWLSGAAQHFAVNVRDPVRPVERVQLLIELLADFFETYLLARQPRMALLSERKPGMDVFFRGKE